MAGRKGHRAEEMQRKEAENETENDARHRAASRVLQAYHERKVQVQVPRCPLCPTLDVEIQGTVCSPHTSLENGAVECVQEECAPVRSGTGDSDPWTGNEEILDVSPATRMGERCEASPTRRTGDPGPAARRLGFLAAGQATR